MSYPLGVRCMLRTRGDGREVIRWGLLLMGIRLGLSLGGTLCFWRWRERGATSSRRCGHRRTSEASTNFTGL